MDEYEIKEAIRKNASVKEVDKLVSQFIESRKETTFNSWSHQTCHLYEQYSFCKAHDDEGILSAKYMKSALRLANKAADYMIEAGRAHCEYRTLSGFLEYNTELMKKHGIDDTPIVLPERFRSQEAKKLLSRSNNDMKEAFRDDVDILAFLEARTLREWFFKMQQVGKVKLAIASDEWYNILSKTPIDKKEQEKIIPSDEVDLDVAFNNLNQARFARKKVDGIFVDIDGTLISSWNEELRENLYQFMKKAKQAGEKVIIFTGGEVALQKERLKKLGVDTKMFPVVSKADYTGCLFTGISIDDTKPGIQGFGLSDKYVYYKDYYDLRNDVDKATQKGQKGSIKELARIGRNLPEEISKKSAGRLLSIDEIDDMIEKTI